MSESQNVFTPSQAHRNAFKQLLTAHNKLIETFIIPYAKLAVSTEALKAFEGDDSTTTNSPGQALINYFEKKVTNFNRLH